MTDYILFYNNHRLLSYLDYISPAIGFWATATKKSLYPESFLVDQQPPVIVRWLVYHGLLKLLSAKTASLV
ncbi:hypothetical protein [Candidatus Sororendozoicomonas aggregata]|uniref:hypothetical protein n=1 Tax=Candidatus Sororendozoicomonas aggregata TaxID=3073239 RepID=UPI002ED333A6